MAEERTYQGHVYRRNSSGEDWVLVGPAGGSSRQATVFQDPMAGYKAPKAAADIANVESIIADRGFDNSIKSQQLGISSEQLRLAQEAAARNARKDAVDAEAVERANRARQSGLIEQKRRAQDLLNEIKRARQLAREGTFATGRFGGSISEIPAGIGAALTQDRSNLENALTGITGGIAQQLMAEMAQANDGGVSGAFNTNTEAMRQAAAIANLDVNADEAQLMQQLDRAEAYYNSVLNKLSDVEVPGTPQGSPVSSVNENLVGAIGPKLTAAEVGSDTRGVPIPDEYQAAHTKYLRDNWGRIDPDAYAQFRQMMDERFGFSPDIEAYRSVVPALNARAGQAGARPEQYTIGPVEQRMTEGEQFRNDLVSGPGGALSAGFANAVGLGIPSMMAPEQFNALREDSPWWMLGGEIPGAFAGTGLASAGLGQVAGRVANPTVASVLSNPMTADAAYGAAYGATQADNPLAGASVGGLSALLGNRAGNWIGGKIGGRQAARQDTRNAGEQSVASALAGTDINDITGGLRQAQSMGVPAMAADLSPELNTLGGVAIRSNPTVAGSARNVLGERGAGQIDRLQGALARDLGDPQNIPDRIQGIMRNAQAQSAPLYDAAYAAPGAGAVFPKIEDLLSRPSMRSSMARARTIAAEEGRDPTTLGFDFDDAGETVLTRVPSWQTIDYVKRGVDDVLNGFKNPVTGKLVLDEHGRAIDATRRNFLNIIDEVNPAYKEARATYAVPAQESEYLRRGEQALNMRPSQLGVNMGNSTEPQNEALRIGTLGALSERANKVRESSNPFDAVFGTPEQAQRLNTVFSNNPEGVANILAQADLERQLAQSSSRLIGNSATAERLAADEAFNAANSGIGDDLTFAAIEAAASGGLPIASGARALFRRSAGNKMSDKKVAANAQRAEEIAPLILNTDTAATIAALEDLAARTAAQEELVKALTSQRSLQGARIGGVGGASVAGALLGQ